MNKLRASDFVQFAGCRRSWMYRAIRGWEVESLGRNADMGTAIHAGLAEFYKHPGGYDSSVAFRTATDLKLSYEDACKCQDVVLFFLEHDDTEIEGILTVEEDTDLLIPELDLVIATHFDVAFMEKGFKAPVIRDHKTKDDIPSKYDWFDLDWQMKVYQVAGWKKYGEPCAVEHNLIRREVPPGFGHRPLVNEIHDSKGRIYNKKSTASTDPAKYLKKIRFEKSEATLQHYYKEIVRTAEEMLYAKANPKTYNFNRQSSFLCDGCPFLVPCLREQDGEELPISLVNQLYLKAK